MNSNSLGIPIAIVIAAGLIAGAILFNGQQAAPVAVENDRNIAEQPEPVVLPVTSEDHIKGNPNAPILIVEYSDFDCPFCKNFHETMNLIMEEYGPDGQVGWVFRHFPLQNLHPNAFRVAMASECVNELGGNEAFWKFTDMAYEERGTNEPTDITRLSEFATSAGVDARAFEACLDSNKYEQQIGEDVQEAINAGGQGTPHSIVLVGDQQGVINGAQPYEVVKNIVDGLISQLEGGQIGAEGAE